MYYHRLGTLPLNPDYQKKFGIEQVSARFDELGNGVVINHPENGLLAGDRIRSRLKSRSEPHEGMVYWLTDDYNALMSARLVEARLTEESVNLQSRLGALAIIGSDLPQLAERDDAATTRYGQALERIVFEDRRVLNTDKQSAREELEQAVEHFRSRGIEMTSRIGEMIIRAADNYEERYAQIAKSIRATRDRQDNLEGELRADKITRNRLAALERSFSIERAPAAFLQTAIQRVTKPGVLTVNNAWFHRHKETSWQDMMVAQEGWEALYGPMMRPVSMLANERIKDLRAEPEFKLARYVLLLSSLEDVIDLSMIGGDYTRLAWQLQIQLFKVEELLLNGEVDDKFYSEAKKAAEDYRFLLRYRTMPGSPPPQEWYSGLPGTKPDKAKFDQPEDPFEGLA